MEPHSQKVKLESKGFLTKRAGRIEQQTMESTVRVKKTQVSLISNIT
jgi:hypothetical protein